MTRILALSALAALLAGNAVAADETVATATPADAHPPGAEAPPPPPLSANARPRDGGGDVLMTPCGPEPVNDRGEAAMNPHGEVSVGAGTHGYREVGGTVCQPLSGGGFVAITADSSRFGR